MFNIGDWVVHRKMGRARVVNLSPFILDCDKPTERTRGFGSRPGHGYNGSPPYCTLIASPTPLEVSIQDYIRKELDNV